MRALLLAAFASCVMSTEPAREIMFPGIGEECVTAQATDPFTVVVEAPDGVPVCRLWYVSPAVCFQFYIPPGETEHPECERAGADPCRAGYYYFDILTPGPGAILMFSFDTEPES